MYKPVILTVNDNPELLKASKSRLTSEFCDRFEVLMADGGATALEALKQLKQRRMPVALLLVEQQMSGMTGIEFLEKALEISPEAKCVLLTAMEADSDIRNIKTTVKIDCYFLKPSAPSEERFYPVLQDLLDDWLSLFRSPFEGIIVIGFRWSPSSHQVKDFLARNQRPFQWLDIETEQEACHLVEEVKSARLDGASRLQLPLVLFSDGSHLEAPTPTQLAEKIKLNIHAKMPFYDLVIVGGGPAGLAAGVYGASEGLHTVIVDRVAPGGQAGTSSLIENYLGFPSGLSGADLARRAVVQAEKFGVEFLSPQEVTGIRVQDCYRFVTLADRTELGCYALLIAVGVEWRQLDVPGIRQLTGAGVYYGASITEAFSCHNEEIYMVGGANSAAQAAMYFSKYARTVTMLVRGDSLTSGMSQYLIDHVEATENITVKLRTCITEVKGEDRLEAITIATDTGETQTVPATSLFIFIGAKPNTEWLADVVKRDERGFILSGPDLLRDSVYLQEKTLNRDPFLLETSVPGIFVAGDVRHGSVKRCASAVGEGSIAVQFIHQYLSKVK